MIFGLLPSKYADGYLLWCVGAFGVEMNYSDKEKIWSLRYAESAESREAVLRLAAELDISPITAKLIYNRGYKSPEAAKGFIRTGIESLHDPYLMKDMDLAVKRIARALRDGERITVYGDYDVDGVTSVSLTYLYLKAQGASIDYYIPSRNKEGYGVSRLGIDKLYERGTTLIITVDTGITATDEVEYAKGLGIDTVVTDHHECYASLPKAEAVVNPHRPDCEYPFCELAGVGVAFKLLCALEEHLHPELSKVECARNICDGYVDLTAIGTVADVMPVCDENRFIVDQGIKKISATDRCGLAALIETASSTESNSQPAVGNTHKQKKRKVNTGFIGFTLAPRINAAGRISSAEKAVELLLCEDYEEALSKAQELCEINLCRQVEENRIAEQAYKMIEQTHNFETDKVIILDNDSWQQGIIGIVSSRITEKYGLPSILISYEGATRGFASSDDIGKGSGRSIKGLNLVDALGYCEDVLEKFGGHELAAGLSVRRGNVETFREKINEYAAAHLTDEDIKIKYEADCEISYHDVTMELVQEIDMLEPFGVSNAAPLFLLRDLEIDKIISLGAGNHCKIFFMGEEHNISAVFFGVPASKLDFCRGEKVDILCRLGINEFRGVRSLQFILQDIRMSENFASQRITEKEKYRKISGGGEFSASDDILPTRDEVAAVYRFLRYEIGLGHSVFSDRALKSRVDTCIDMGINYVKLRFILDILTDMRVMSVTEISGDIFEFHLCENVQKTSIESSDTFKMLTANRKG